MTADDNELIAQAQRGDVFAFEQLVYRYDRQVLSMALKYTNNKEDAKDIYQEVFIRIYRALPRFEFRSKFSTWLYRIAANTCITHRASRKDHLETSLDEEFENARGDSYSLSDSLRSSEASDQYSRNSEINLHVQKAMSTLSPQQKLVFALRHYQGYKLREIASMMNCAEGTVKKYLFTATERMREQLKGVYGQ
jgi:RNA polymerase sigma-70 factor (ECF subfamily)